MENHLLCLCCSFPPEVTPTSIRAGKILSRLCEQWSIDVVTAVENGSLEKGVAVRSVAPWKRLRPLLDRLTRNKLDKIPNWFVWPDDQIFWVRPAVRAAHELLRRRPAAAIVVFMMPYSAGIVGILLKRATGLPLVLNLDDSITCADMHSSYPTRLHYLLARRLEDWYVRQADAVIYVSQVNLDMVSARLRPEDRRKLHLVRYGADPADYSEVEATELPAPRLSVPHVSDPEARDFNIVYIGGMSGWFEFYHQPEKRRLGRRLYRAWVDLGRYELVHLEQGGSSPVYIGKAAQAVVADNPDWQGRIKVRVYGNKYPTDAVARVLANTGIEDVVTVTGTLPNAEAIRLARNADLLFMALPARADNSPGGRISAKTYEYLMTDRPILAAIPRGENRDYLEGKPGVWITDPDDVAAMQCVIAELAAARFAGHPLTYDRSALRAELSYDTKAAEFAAVIQSVTQRTEKSQCRSEF
jgi:glycosyltransferase involved in cell wall biosynthesis